MNRICLIAFGALIGASAVAAPLCGGFGQAAAVGSVSPLTASQIFARVRDLANPAQPDEQLAPFITSLTYREREDFFDRIPAGQDENGRRLSFSSLRLGLRAAQSATWAERARLLLRLLDPSSRTIARAAAAETSNFTLLAPAELVAEIETEALSALFSADSNKYAPDAELARLQAKLFDLMASRPGLALRFSQEPAIADRLLSMLVRFRKVHESPASDALLDALVGWLEPRVRALTVELASEASLSQGREELAREWRDARHVAHAAAVHFQLTGRLEAARQFEHLHRSLNALGARAGFAS